MIALQLKHLTSTIALTISLPVDYSIENNNLSTLQAPMPSTLSFAFSGGASSFTWSNKVIKHDVIVKPASEKALEEGGTSVPPKYDERKILQGKELFS
jgi:hypothetical protein